MVRHIIATSLAVAFLVSAGCAPLAGKRGELGFSYEADDSIGYVTAKRGLAAGCEADLVAYSSDATENKTDVIWGDRVLREAKRIDVTRATSSNPEVLEVAGIDGARVRLRGASPGTSELRIATASGSDMIDMRVVVTDHVQLDHLAWASDKATPSQTVLLQGGTVHFGLSRKDGEGRTLACYEPDGAVEIEPADAVRIVNRDRDMGHLRLSVEAPERVSVVPTSGSRYVFETTSASDVRSVEVDFVRGEDASKPLVLEVDDSHLFRVNARSKEGRYVLGLDGVLEVASQTPDICEVASLAQLTSDGLYAVRGLAVGTCRLSVSLGDATASRAFEIAGGPGS